MLNSISLPLSHITLAGLCSVTNLEDLDTAKPLIVALHGWLDNSASFIPLEQEMEDYQWLAIDMAGHGHSDHRSADAHYHLVDFVQDLHEVIQSTGFEQVILLSHSLGGIVSSMYAACFPERVSKLIVIESFGPLSKEADSAAEQLRESIESRLRINQSSGKHPSALRDAVLARMAAGKMLKSSAQLLVERNLVSEPELAWRTDRRLRTISSMRVTEDQAESFLRGITAPMLVITGSQGFEKLKVNLQRRRHWVSDLTAAECPGHHHMHMDEPKPVAAQIISFLSR